jgi:hypothetical protein
MINLYDNETGKIIEKDIQIPNKDFLQVGNNFEISDGNETKVYKIVRITIPLMRITDFVKQINPTRILVELKATWKTEFIAGAE